MTDLVPNDDATPLAKGFGLPTECTAGGLNSWVQRREQEIRDAGCHECGGPYSDRDHMTLNMATGRSEHWPSCPEIVEPAP